MFRRKGAFVQSDWIESDLLLVELENKYLAVKIRWPGDALDEAYFLRLEQSARRVFDYFERPVLPLLADCSKNGVPLSARPHDSEAAAMARRHGCLYAEGIHLYGWHMEGALDADAWAARLQQNGEPCARQLRQTIARSLEQEIGHSGSNDAPHGR